LAFVPLSEEEDDDDDGFPWNVMLLIVAVIFVCLVD
jgi:hypothetical protein